MRDVSQKSSSVLTKSVGGRAHDVSVGCRSDPMNAELACPRGQFGAFSDLTLDVRAGLLDYCPDLIEQRFYLEWMEFLESCLKLIRLTRRKH